MPWYEPSTSEGHGAMTVVTRRRNGTLRLSTAGKLFRTFVRAWARLPRPPQAPPRLLVVVAASTRHLTSHAGGARTLIARQGRFLLPRGDQPSAR
jgi:hypothetical protein